MTFNNNALDYTLTGTGMITGITSLTKTGSGTVVLANTNGNTFTGAASIDGGTLVLGSTGAVQNSAGERQREQRPGLQPGRRFLQLGRVERFRALVLADTSGKAVAVNFANAASTTYSGASAAPARSRKQGRVRSI